MLGTEDSPGVIVLELVDLFERIEHHQALAPIRPHASLTPRRPRTTSMGSTTTQHAPRASAGLSSREQHVRAQIRRRDSPTPQAHPIPFQHVPEGGSGPLLLGLADLLICEIGLRGHHDACLWGLPVPADHEGGLEDAHQHGKDLFGVYGDKPKFLPATFDPRKVLFRVTSNVITSQTASAIAKGMYGNNKVDIPLYQQYSAVDSLQPQYSCSYVDGVRSGFQFELDCALDGDADSLQALGRIEWRLYEYSCIFRDAPQSLEYARTKYGVYFVELVQHMRHVISGECEVMYRHNVAHDGSISPVLSFLQVDEMVWPGMRRGRF
ncbi:histidine phosphatase superfamily [Cladochytrium replicatum]|nr:histidine phosphatase superfamily [Cladochytrium replicatum]